MDPSAWASGLVVCVVALVLVASGPIAGGFVAPSGTPTTVGDGNATVATVDVATDSLVVSSGRFGTTAAYLRMPDARVDLASVSGHPRVLYLVRVPALDAEVSASRIVTRRGEYRLHVRDYGLSPDAVDAETYDATVQVRVQSFTVDRTVFERNVTVEVRR